MRQEQTDSKSERFGPHGIRHRAYINEAISIDGSLAKEIDSYFRKLVADAAKSGKPIPKISNVYEEVVTKEWELMKKEGRK